MRYYIFDLHLLSFDLWPLFAILKKAKSFNFYILFNIFVLAFLNFSYYAYIFFYPWLQYFWWENDAIL